MLVNYDHIGTCFVYGGGVMPAGRRVGLVVGKYSTMPRAQNKTAKGSTLLRRRIHFAPLGFIFICGVWQLAIMLSDRFHKKQKDKEYIVCSAVPVFDSVFPYLANRRI